MVNDGVASFGVLFRGAAAAEYVGDLLREPSRFADGLGQLHGVKGFGEFRASHQLPQVFGRAKRGRGVGVWGESQHHIQRFVLLATSPFGGIDAPFDALDRKDLDRETRVREDLGEVNEFTEELDGTLRFGALPFSKEFARFLVVCLDGLAFDPRLHNANAMPIFEERENFSAKDSEPRVLDFDQSARGVDRVDTVIRFGHLDSVRGGGVKFFQFSVQ